MKNTKYDHQKVEKKWQEVWTEKKIYQSNLSEAEKPFYNLMMFPYPSAEGLHVGNMYAFTGSDIFGRYKRMSGFNVFEPIGLDGFGIHSENYALKVGRHPKEQAKISQENFYRQLHQIGNGYAWNNKLETYDPQYYKWTQWIFTKMFENNLAYRKKANVKWCPSCKTVLSDEQVEGGVCERCKSEVTTKELEQWFFKITDYTEHLLNNLKTIDWSPKVKEMQKNWIGKKIGINITYSIEELDKTITVFTTRPDTNFGATFIVLAPEYPLALEITTSEHKKEAEKYVKEAKNKSEIERIAEGRKKSGVFTGRFAINPLNNKKMPIWISDFVLKTVGTGALVGVPGHDKRDFEFAVKFKLPVVRVLVGKDGDKSEIKKVEQVYEENGTVINSNILNGLATDKAMEKIMDYLEKKGWGKRSVSYHLRDWLISRQRYWGPPIPMIYCEKCGWQTVPEKDLPVLLPEIKNWRPLGTGEGPLASDENFVRTKCPKCGGSAKRETDVSDTFLDSSWYFLRYPSVNENDTPWNKEITKKWLPVDMYIGGAEHSVLHLLYSRFLTMVFKDWGLLNFEEPYKKFRAHGLLISEGAKMSKSRGNVINPDDYIKKYGADVLRMYLMFLGPFDQGGDFQDKGVIGVKRFLTKVWNLQFTIKKIKNVEQARPLQILLNKLIKKVTEDIENLKFNTAIAAMMEFLNEVQKLMEADKKTDESGLTYEEFKTFLKLLAPFAPHMTEELWQRISNEQMNNKTNEQKKQFRSIHQESWPQYDKNSTQDEEVEIIVQVNGKMKTVLTVNSKQLTVKEEIIKLAKENEKVANALKDKKIKNTIFVPGRLINFVIASE